MSEFKESRKYVYFFVVAFCGVLITFILWTTLSENLVSVPERSGTSSQRKILSNSSFQTYRQFSSLNLDEDVFDVCTVGAGLSGAVIAERYAVETGARVLVIESRSHIGGNTFDYVDPITQILIGKYGAHLFHTNIDHVWKYINSIPNSPPWIRWDHTVLGFIDNKFVPIPVNINTVNALFDLSIKNEAEMSAWLKSVQIPCPESNCENSEQMALSRVGSALFEKIFKDYTIKQWDKAASELDALVTSRIPVRNNFDNRYFDDKYQALPSKGYTAWVNSLLSHQNISVLLNEDYFLRRDVFDRVCNKIYFTGPIDRYFSQSDLPKLEYRGINFHLQRHLNVGFVQPASVVNYPSAAFNITRIVEYKHFLYQNSIHSVTVSETSANMGPEDDPYYPVPNTRNNELYSKYQRLAENLESDGRVYFLGRLANYKYFNMDQTIDNALKLFYQHNPDLHFSHFVDM
jgi:UDP-galactopyranose mutase